MRTADKRYPLFAIALSLLFVGIADAGTRKGQSVSADPDFLTGLSRWRETDRQNTACGFCHSPDGIEIAAFNFDDETIRRRATPHVGKDDAEDIVKFIHAVRRQNHLTKLLDPMSDRPLQPGGHVLPGATEAERDGAFGSSLKTLIPLLTQGKIDSLSTAEQAKEELEKVNPRELPVGILFNRISEDGFHGTEHATFAHWISDEPLMLKFPWGNYFQLEGVYLDNPTIENLDPLLQMAYRQPSQYWSAELANDKFRALLVLSHIERLQARGEDFFKDKGAVAMLFGTRQQMPNPLLHLGLQTDRIANLPFEDLKFRKATLEKKVIGPPEQQQLRQIRLPALYLGWLFDEGLMRSEACPPAKAIDVVSSRLLADGPYPLHDVFLLGKRAVVAGFGKDAWGNLPVGQHFRIDFGAFMQPETAAKYQPKDSEAAALYRRFLSNSLLMSLFLYKHQLEASKSTFGDDAASDAAKARTVIAEIDPQSVAIADRLVKGIKALAGETASNTSK